MNDSDERTNLNPAGRDPSEDPLGALLRATGRRGAVPAERAERVKAAVEAHWQADVGRRSRRRRRTAAMLATAATVIVAVGLGIWRLGVPGTGGADAARVEIVVRDARSTAVDLTTALSPGDLVPTGSELATGADGLLALRMESGHSVRMDSRTSLRVVSDRIIALERGAIYVDSRG